jgi:hypothetical protein
MLRVTTLHASSAAATAAYCAQYLTAAPGEAPGVWSGRQAAGLGLSGRVGVEHLEALLSGRDPTTGTPLGRELLDRYTADSRVVRAVPEDLDGVRVFVDPGMAMVPEGHRLAGRKQVAMADLEGERIVAPLQRSMMRPLFDAVFRRHGFIPVIAAEGATNDMTLELVRAGVGCAVTVASSVAPAVGRGAVAIELADQAPTDISLVTRRRQDPTPAACAFRDLALERFGV